jgi:hypothetical protein
MTARMDFFGQLITQAIATASEKNESSYSNCKFRTGTLNKWWLACAVEWTMPKDLEPE